MVSFPARPHNFLPPFSPGHISPGHSNATSTSVGSSCCPQTASNIQGAFEQRPAHRKSLYETAPQNVSMDDNALQPQTFRSSRRFTSQHLSDYAGHHIGEAHTSQHYGAQHLDSGLNSLDNGDGPFESSYGQQLQETGEHQLQLTPTYERSVSHFSPEPAGTEIQKLRQQPLSSTTQPQQHATPPSTQFRVIDSSSEQFPGSFSRGQSSACERIQQDTGLGQSPSASNAAKTEAGHFTGMRLISNPPDLEIWREKLFSIDAPITMTEEQFQTYFPHVDNVYSHRSTQRYKRKPFISHYWDCRLKGRPPGTPKSDDPNKKKRKRQARERDLCDVKIKITEYFPGARAVMAQMREEMSGAPSENLDLVCSTDGSIIGSHNSMGPPGTNGEKYYTISRVNGSSTQSGEGGIIANHKHTLEESDRIKKSSVQRQCLREEKEKRKAQKSYHKRATGVALQTAKKRSKDSDLKLYGSCFCPFVQRVWIALEHKNLTYQYIEIDPYKKPQSLLALNPLGLVPALQHGTFSCYESTVLLEYLDDVFGDQPLLPSTPSSRAYVRLWADHVNRNLIPAFYRTLQAQDQATQASSAEELKSHIQKLVDAANPQGPFFLGSQIGWVDIQLAPWLLRLSRVLGPYRGWPNPEKGSRWGRWVDAIEANESVKSTTSGDELYIDSYERYASNRPGTSKLADAVNSGRGLP